MTGPAGRAVLLPGGLMKWAVPVVLPEGLVTWAVRVVLPADLATWAVPGWVQGPGVRVR
jgi:hypothetical protein